MASPVVPGQVLGTTSSHSPGPGTHVYENNILASVLGTVAITAAADKAGKATISVPRQPASSAASAQGTVPRLPKVGSVVLCRVTRVQQRQLGASVLVVVDGDGDDGHGSSTSPADIVSYSQATNDDLQFQAVLRREDIRTHEKDKIAINDMYRVGDVIRATVISLGDEKNYYISTAGNEFGVVVATSDAGNAMVPASWKEMRDVVTGKAESRKVARPS